jgi:peptidoglycan-associated lipoprotein
MIQKILIITASILLLSGCASKSGKFGAEGGTGSTATHNVSDSTQIAGETVSINENVYGNESKDTSSVEAGKVGAAMAGAYNSSTGGFKSVYFNYDSYTVSSQMESQIINNVQASNATNSRIKVEGNCDEFGTDEYNYALGLKRAKAVKDTLISQGVSASKIVMVSFGESNPACRDLTDACYEQNRRVDLHIAQ